jgi:hypothetical protein
MREYRAVDNALSDDTMHIEPGGGVARTHVAPWPDATEPAPALWERDRGTGPSRLQKDLDARAGTRQ